MKAEQAWQATIGQLQMEMPKAAFDTWVRNTEFVSYEDGCFIIGVQNAYARDWLENRLASTVKRILTGIMNRTVEVRFSVWQSNNESTEADEDESTIQSAASFANNGSLSPRYTFENFVVGASNRLAHAASLAVAEKPSEAYNPLFLYGGVGLGKTHLLHAIGNMCHQRGQQVLYVSSEEFPNDLITAIRVHPTQAFREKYRRIDVLLIDDIQFIAGKESTQEEFFHTFNTLHGQDKQIVISSDRPPKAMVTLEERLRSRFEWGLAADIQPPDLETRQAILRAKADRAGYKMPNDIIELIARRVQSNIRELEGALTRLTAHATLTGKRIDIDFARHVLRDLLHEEIRTVSIEDIQKKVASYYNINHRDMRSSKRTRTIAFPRQVAMFASKELTAMSLPEIGELFGGRDHTTVLHAVRKINKMRKESTEFNEEIERILTILRP